MKKIYDSLHGFIYLDAVEEKLIRSKPMVRLQGILQLGAAYLVYPGATHSRFEHSLGTMAIATKIYDRIMTMNQSSLLPKIDSVDQQYYRRIVRLSALCHDLGHLPFSHSAENYLLGKTGHEAWTMRIIKSEDLKPVWDALREEIAVLSPDKKYDIEMDIIKCSIGPDHLQDIDPTIVFSPIERILSLIVTADLFGADRIDYLLRDTKATGLPYGNIDYMQLIESLRIKFDKTLNTPVLGIAEDGIESCEALLLARYFMHQRLCQYPSVKAYCFHVARFMTSFYKEHKLLESLPNYIKGNDHMVLADIYAAADSSAHPRHFDALRLLKQQPRFKAYRLPPAIKETDIKQIKNSLDIPDLCIGWDFNPREKEQFDLSFLPFKEQENLTHHWVFIDPSYKNSFLKQLGWNEKYITED